VIWRETYVDAMLHTSH